MAVERGEAAVRREDRGGCSYFVEDGELCVQGARRVPSAGVEELQPMQEAIHSLLRKRMPSETLDRVT